MVVTFDDRFEVTWHDPDDAQAVWAIDRIHFAQPLAPLGYDFYEVVVRGSWEARVAIANGYLFLKDFRPPPTPPEVTEMGALPIWREKYLPAVQQLCDEIRTPDYDAMMAAEIVVRLPEVFRKSALAFRYPTVITSTFMAPALQLAVFCQQVLGDEGPVLAATLLQGYDNASAAAGAGLGELASLATQHSGLAEALKAHRFDELAAQPGGEEFLASLTSFLDAYGWRAEEWCLVHKPAWAEQPDVALSLVARYLGDPEHSPERAHERAVVKRVAAATEIEARLPDADKAKFQAMLDAALAHVPLSEERAMWQLIAIGSVRVPLLALGRKLVTNGVIDEANDVFFLRLAQLAEIAASPRAMTDLVAQRKADLARYERMEPPQSIGAPLVIEDRPGPSQVIHRYFFGTIAPASDERVIRGNAASQGVVTGRARMVRSLSESGALEPGEILVCRTTAPPWTPLFAIAAAVVTETGGILSHSAICAREYGIPCVVGTRIATSRIPDGALVTVDGNKGTVTIEEGDLTP